MQSVTIELTMADVPANAVWYAGVKPEDNAIVELTEDGEHKCLHTEAVVEYDRGGDGITEPGASWSVNCYECHNDHLTQTDADNLIENYVEGRIDDGE